MTHRPAVKLWLGLALGALVLCVAAMPTVASSTIIFRYVGDQTGGGEGGGRPPRSGGSRGADPYIALPDTEVPMGDVVGMADNPVPLEPLPATGGTRP